MSTEAPVHTPSSTMRESLLTPLAVSTVIIVLPSVSPVS